MYQVKVDPLYFKSVSITSNEFTSAGDDDVTMSSHKTCDGNHETFEIQDPNTEKVQKNAIYLEKTQHAYFQGNHLYQATK